MNKHQSRAKSYFPATFFKRTECILIRETEFFYKTREGQAEGPFKTEALALYDMNNYTSAAALESELQLAVV